MTQIPERRFGELRVRVPVLGQGTWNMESDDRSSAIAALRRGLDLGMWHIDTAELYGRGRVEEMVAEAIEGRRDEVFLVSKVLPGNASRRGVLRACEASLKRLRTDRLDVYLLHWPGNHPLEDTIASFEELVSSGKIRAWGVSNFDIADLASALEIAGPHRIACNQVLYHLRERGIEHEVVPFCEAQGIAVVAYSPFGSGRFPPPTTSGGRVLGEIARAHGSTAHAVALRFLTRKESVFAIPKASRKEHVEANVGAMQIELAAEEIQRIEEAFPVGRRRPLETI